MMEKERLEELLKEWLPKKSTAYTCVVHVAQSGMSRHIKVLVAPEQGQIRDISGYVADYLGWRHTKKEAVFVGGCGMDMGFHLVYTLSSKLYGDGYAIKQAWV